MIHPTRRPISCCSIEFPFTSLIFDRRESLLMLSMYSRAQIDAARPIYKIGWRRHCHRPVSSVSPIFYQPINTIQFDLFKIYLWPTLSYYIFYFWVFLDYQRLDLDSSLFSPSKGTSSWCRDLDGVVILFLARNHWTLIRRWLFDADGSTLAVYVYRHSFCLWRNLSSVHCSGDPYISEISTRQSSRVSYYTFQIVVESVKERCRTRPCLMARLE